MALFPFIPNVPGVPALLRDALRPIEPVLLLLSDVLDVLSGVEETRWGIYLDGEPVVLADNVVSVEYRESWSIASYPLEEGAFENYNKVQTPFAVKVRFSAGGNASDRAAFMSSIDQVMGDLELYDVVTPEKVYTSVNFERQDYRRTAQSGAGLVSVDVWLSQVSVTAQAAFSQTQSASGASQVNGGTVQASPYTGPNLGPLQRVQ